VFLTGHLYHLATEPRSCKFRLELYTRESAGSAWGSRFGPPKKIALAREDSMANGRVITRRTLLRNAAMGTLALASGAQNVFAQKNA
jgi:hypothetical protein